MTVEGPPPKDVSIRADNWKRGDFTLGPGFICKSEIKLNLFPTKDDKGPIILRLMRLSCCLGCSKIEFVPITGFGNVQGQQS